MNEIDFEKYPPYMYNHSQFSPLDLPISQLRELHTPIRRELSLVSVQFPNFPIPPPLSFLPHDLCLIAYPGFP